MKLTFLSENKTEIGVCGAEFGLSMLIETTERKILFDAGASDLFARNALARGVDLAEVDLCVVSHGHFDHTNGIPAFCRINDHAPVYIHKDAFHTIYGTTDGVIDDYNCGILWTEEEKAALAPRLVLTDGAVWLDGDTVISGTIPDAPEFKPVEDFYLVMPDGSLAPDTLRHEQFLAIRTGEGVYLFSGCSHKGVPAAVRYCRTLFPGEPLAGVIAGMHLAFATPAMRSKVIDLLAAEDPKLIIPVHCTGLEAIYQIKAKFGARCIMASAGKRYDLP